MLLFSQKIVNSAMMLNRKFQENRFTPFFCTDVNFPAGWFRSLFSYESRCAWVINATINCGCVWISQTDMERNSRYDSIGIMWGPPIHSNTKGVVSAFTGTTVWKNEILWEKNNNIISGFRKCRILPLNKHDILTKTNRVIDPSEREDICNSMSGSVLEHLSQSL